MDNLKHIFKLYFRPASAMSDIMDSGSWMFAAIAVLIVSLPFFVTVNAKLETVYRVPSFAEYYQPPHENNADPQRTKVEYDRAMLDYNNARADYQKVPLVGDRFYDFFSFEAGKFFEPLLLLSIFYVPVAVLLMSIFGGIGGFALVLRRDYGTLAVCTLTAWAAAHLPFAVAGVLLFGQILDPQIYLGFWAGSSLIFGILMVFALRTVFGSNYVTAILVVSIAWLSLSFGMHVFHYFSPWLFSPFLIFFAFIYLGGFLGGEIRGFGNAFRQKQNFKRFLHNATVNPKDADAHVQLGLIYLQRRQESKAIDHLNKAIEIDKTEIDANYELGKIARAKGDLQASLDHFAIVVEQNEKFSLSEVWREIGATYLEANMLNEAREALEKFVERRSAEVEGLYYLGKVYKAQGESEKAREMFEEAINSAKSMPVYRRRKIKHWSRLAQKDL